MADQRRALDATDVLFEIGNQVQTVALTMRKHRYVVAQQVCECGRLATQMLPVFGPRCEIAVEGWVAAHDAMRRLLRQAAGVRRSSDAVIGRATVSIGTRRHA